MPSHSLQNTWVLWELRNSDSKDYNNALREVCEFNTVEDFWKFWSFIPKPSEVFGDGNTKIMVDGRTIKAFGVFKKGIQPAWEDPANCKGSELQALKSFTPEVLDALWENLVLGLIGETIDEGDEICGCRVVNQTRKARPTFKIELWLRTADEGACSKIKVRLCDVLTDGEASKPNGKMKAPEFELVKRKL